MRDRVVIWKRGDFKNCPKLPEPTCVAPVTWTDEYGEVWVKILHL